MKTKIARDMIRELRTVDMMSALRARYELDLTWILWENVPSIKEASRNDEFILQEALYNENDPWYEVLTKIENGSKMA